MAPPSINVTSNSIGKYQRYNDCVFTFVVHIYKVKECWKLQSSDCPNSEQEKLSFFCEAQDWLRTSPWPAMVLNPGRDTCQGLLHRLSAIQCFLQAKLLGFFTYSPLYLLLGFPSQDFLNIRHASSRPGESSQGRNSPVGRSSPAGRNSPVVVVCKSPISIYWLTLCFRLIYIWIFLQRATPI